ncbi:hypothetical protein LBC_03270 [Campylobacter sp. 19-13652]|nr:hypothetical protein LBC_03270 [Campylobacter sp. 19-13652]
MPHLDIGELIRFYFVFDALMIKGAYYDIFEAIYEEILPRAGEISIALNLSQDERAVLCKLARGDRRYFSAYKLMLKQDAARAYASLLGGEYLFIEPTFEVRPKRDKRQKLPRYQRRRLIQNKLHFCTHFLRFFFYFIEPNLKLLMAGKKDEVMAMIKREFDVFCSLGFERLSCELVAKKLGAKCTLQSLWVDKTEIDIFGFCEQGAVAAEAKYRGKKVCKSVLSQLENKCKALGVLPYHLGIVSACGFSNELLRLKSERVGLYDLEDFKELL